MAKYFAAEAGQRVVRAAQHLHGGVGVDRDYPLAPLLPVGQAARAHPRRRQPPAHPLGHLLAAQPLSK